MSFTGSREIEACYSPHRMFSVSTQPHSLCTTTGPVWTLSPSVPHEPCCTACQCGVLVLRSEQCNMLSPSTLIRRLLMELVSTVNYGHHNISGGGKPIFHSPSDNFKSFVQSDGVFFLPLTFNQYFGDSCINTRRTSWSQHEAEREIQPWVRYHVVG